MQRRNVTTHLPPHDHPVIAAYVQNQIRLIRRYVNLAPQTRLLEIGCGNGYFTFYLDRIVDVFGMDVSDRMLRLNPVKKTARMDASDLKFGDNSFDVVFCHEALHHAGDAEQIVREMARVTRRHVVIVEPNRRNPIMFTLGLLAESERTALKFTPRHLRKTAERHGLRVTAAFAYGMMIPAATPVWLLPVAKAFNFKQPFGWESFVFAERDYSACHVERSEASRCGDKETLRCAQGDNGTE
jgi:SAM-dependent methyltransferase